MRENSFQKTGGAFNGFTIDGTHGPYLIPSVKYGSNLLRIDDAPCCCAPALIRKTNGLCEFCGPELGQPGRLPQPLVTLSVSRDCFMACWETSIRLVDVCQTRAPDHGLLLVPPSSNETRQGSHPFLLNDPTVVGIGTGRYGKTTTLHLIRIGETHNINNLVSNP